MSDHSNHTTKRTSARVVAGSLLGGVASAVALVAVPFADGGEATITGAILLGLAIGWALLAMLSTRLGDGSHRWAAVPAVMLGLSAAGLIILTPDTAGARHARMDLAAAAARPRVLDDRSDPAPGPGPQAFVAALSRVRGDGVLCRRLRL